MSDEKCTFHKKFEEIKKMAWEMYLSQVNYQNEFWNTFLENDKLHRMRLLSYQHAKEFIDSLEKLKREEEANDQK